MKKFLIILLFIFTLSIFSFVDFSHNNQTNPPALADSGFDADYGDYDSGSSWDNDYDYGGASLKVNTTSICSYCGNALDERFSPYVLFDISYQ